MKSFETEQIKIDGVYYNVTPEDRETLRQLEASVCGACTPEGLKEFRDEIKAVRDRSNERNFEFDCYWTE